MQRFIALIAVCLVACGSGTSGSGGPTGMPDANNNPPPPQCESEIVPAPTMAVCAKATQTCVAACMDDTCIDNCYTADPAADACRGCVDDAITACVNAAGCQAEFDAVQCCALTCADPDSDACYTTTCATQTDAYDTCSSTKGAACTDAVCYKTM